MKAAYLHNLEELGLSSPFTGLRMPQELACEFFALVSRFEYALKSIDRYRRNQRGLAAPAWGNLGSKMGEKMGAIATDSKLSDAVNYLTEQPPKVQLENGLWEDRPLEGDTPIAQAINASVRTRNNLFHGGKHTHHSAPGRDESLVHASMIVLKACLKADEELHAHFNDLL